jgi:hypothetical protein
MPEHHDLRVVREDRPARRFTVLPDGSSRGDDAASVDIAPTVQYACRILAPLGDLLGIGRLDGLDISGAPDLEVSVSRDAQGGMTVRGGLRDGGADVPGDEADRPALPSWQRPTNAADDLGFSLGVLGDVEGVVGGVLLSTDARVVASSAPAAIPGEALSTVGRRAVAVLTSLRRHLRADDLLMTFENGRVLATQLSTGLALALAEPHGDVVSMRLALQVARTHLEQLDLGSLPTLVDRPSGTPASSTPTAGNQPEPSESPDGSKRPRRRLGMWA